MRIGSSFVVIGIVVGLLAGRSSPRLADATEVARGADTPSGEKPGRTVAGLQVLYDFRSAADDVVRDRSGVGKPLNLRISNRRNVRRSSGKLEVRGKTEVRGLQPATRLIEAVRRSGEITVEAWVQPARTDQAGPARIVTLSRGSTQRNFTLGQDGDRFDVRLRTSSTNANGIPSVSTKKGSVKTELTHVVYTRDRTGRARVYINGQPNVEAIVKGSTSQWADAHELALANEFGGGRPWRGTYHVVAIYSRRLSESEVERHFEAGPDAPVVPGEVARVQRPQHSPAVQLFETKIAPLLANHCLECHDTPTKKGGLDLSRKSAGLAGGDSGPAIVSGKAGESLLWEYIVSDEMPADRPPLSADQKALLRGWIDAGAAWSLDVIDPLLYERDDRASENWIRRLTIQEYIQTVRSVVGVDIAKEARALLPPDLRADGFSNTAYNLNVDFKHVDAYARLAAVIVARMDILEFAARFSRSRSLSTDNTMRELVAAMGKRLFRGPLDEREITNYSGIATTVASAGGDFKEAVSLTVEAMLQSPRFIYRVEDQRGAGEIWPVSDYELASRLSYIIWGGPPDEDLMRAADAGELYDQNVIQAQVRRMLEDPRAIERSQEFIYEWLDLARLENMRPNPEKFPGWNDQLAGDMRDETLQFFQDLVWDQQRPLADLLNAQWTYATPRLARHYGLEPRGESLSRYDLSSVPARGGLLTQASVLTVGGDEASMVSRGLFVLHELLRGSVKDPPPCVDTVPPPTKAGLTQRGIAETRIANVNCGGCHAKFEPLAFGLEKFDGIGAFHDADEHGNRLRDDGAILFPGTAKSVAYQSSAELMDLLAASERVRESITWKLTQFALGRPLGATDAPLVGQIHKLAQRDGGTYVSTLTAIVMSDLVQMTRKENTE